MNLSLVTPDKNVFEGEVTSANFPGSNGAFEILNLHAPIVSSLGKGTIKLQTEEGEKKFVIDSGVVEVVNNKIIVLAESLIED